MRIVYISGEAATGKSTMLNILAADARRNVTTATQLCDMIRMHNKGVIKMELQLETFVDEVSAAQRKTIEAFVKDHYPSNDYVLVMAKQP